MSAAQYPKACFIYPDPDLLTMRFWEATGTTRYFVTFINYIITAVCQVPGICQFFLWTRALNILPGHRSLLTRRISILKKLLSWLLKEAVMPLHLHSVYLLLFQG